MKKKLPENTWKSKVLLTRLAQEALFECRWGIPDRGLYWFLIPEADTGRGQNTLKNYKTDIMTDDPHPAQIEMAREIHTLLTRGASMDGYWIVGWTHPPAQWEGLKVDGDNCWGRLAMIWLDEDGDPHFTVEFDRLFADMMDDGAEYFAAMAVQAYIDWSAEYRPEVLRDEMGLADKDMTKAVLEGLK